MALSKRDVAFLVGVAIVVVIFAAVSANASTYVWFLLFAAAMWMARRARREARIEARSFEEALRTEHAQRVADIGRLTEMIAQLGPGAPVTPHVEEDIPQSVATVVEIYDEISGEISAAAAATIETPPLRDEEPPPQVVAIPEPPRDWGRTIRSALDLEQMLGTNWLSKLGVGVLVLGLAFFLAWQLKEVGPLGKVVTGVVVSAILLGLGIWGERRQTYQLLARAALAGGWALLFFVAYAAHHIPATRVVSSPILGLVLMLIIAAAMVGHSLRFRSQVVTGLTFFLAFATVALNRVDVYSLSANVVLAIGFCLLVLRMQWFEMEIFGILAVYLNHYLWLVPIIGPMHGKVHPFPQFAASTTLLLLYWAVFRASYVLRAPKDERTSAFAGVLNIVLLGSVMRYQSAHPELAFWGLLILGVIEIVLGQLPNVRRKRVTFVVLNTIGVALLVAAIPLRFAPDYVSALWLVKAELLFFVGVFTRERLFRRLGVLTAFVTAIYLLGVHGARVLGDHLGSGDPVHHWTLGTIFAAATLILYADSCWMPLRWPALFGDAIDRRAGQWLSYAACATGIAGGWILFSGPGAALAWITFAVLLALIAWRFALPDLTVQANIVAVLAVVRTLAVNLPSNSVIAQVPFGVTYRLLTGSAIVGMLYLLSRWNRGNTLRFTTHLPVAVTWTASALASLLLWYELRPASVAIAWTMLGLLLLETGEARRSRNLRWQAYVALAAGFVRVFVVNLNAEQAGAAIGPRLYTILPIALALLYVHERLYTAGEGHEWERRARLPSVCACLGALCFMGLLRFEVPTDAVATAWAALALGFVALAWIADRRVFLHIGIAVSLATLGRAILHDLYERSYFPWPGKADPWMFAGGAAALLLASLPFAFRLKRVPAETAGTGLRRILIRIDERPEQILFLVPLVLITALLATEMRRDMITVAWGIEAVVVFLFALWVKERSYRLSGLALLLLCAGKVLMLDFWSLSIRAKALTGIVMGLALIGVSFLYTHKRDIIRQFL
ncbi:MAG TPA: DUF2339 domain-containing protein [Thermoanaerobaculia bacterium]|nr:DUF2339 domain-containing protein [Thermoanaerobaculia bacterium]